MPSKCYSEGLLQAVPYKGLTVGTWQSGWQVDAREESTGGSPEPTQLGVSGNDGCMAVACVVGSHFMPAIATDWVSIKAPEPTWAKSLAQLQCVFHECTGSLLKASVGFVELFLRVQAREHLLCPSPGGCPVDLSMRAPVPSPEWVPFFPVQHCQPSKARS